MPHTRRKKKPHEHAKRREVIDEDGWTRVITSTAKSLQALNLAPAPLRPVEGESTANTTILATDVPPDASVEKLNGRYSKIEEQWLASESYMAAASAIRAHHSGNNAITKCIILGSGTLCGYRSGWIGRHDVAMLQVAVFLSVVAAIANIQNEKKPACYAQEPLYNDLDREFLRQRKIEVLDHPDGLEKIDGTTFVYAPGVERDIAERLYRANPAMVLSHQAVRYFQGLNQGGGSQMVASSISTVAKSYLESHDAVRLPNYDMANDPFHEQFLHYRKEEEQVEDDNTTSAST